MTIKPETVSHVAEQFSWVPLPCCSPPRPPFPIKSLALSARVSPQAIHFRVLDKSPLSGPGRGSPFLQHDSNWKPPTCQCLQDEIRSWEWSPHEWDECPYKREPRELSRPLSAMWGHNGKSAVCNLKEPDHAGTLILDFQPPELWETDFCGL